jgi:hypothetical protein
MGRIDGMGGHRVPVSKHLEIGYGIAWIAGRRVKQTKAYYLVSVLRLPGTL